jgi:hydrogenase maturation protease
VRTIKKILIGGIGNVLLGDDGAGPYIARILAAHYEFTAEVEVEDLGTPALDLIDRISGKDAIILIDSVDANDAVAVPGTVLLYRKADIMRHAPAVRMDPHSPALVDAILSADLFGTAPADVLLVGIAAESYDAGCTLSEPVKAALDQAIAAVLSELDRLGVSYRRREHSDEVSLWWLADKKTTSPVAR